MPLAPLRFWLATSPHRLPRVCSLARGATVPARLLRVRRCGSRRSPWRCQFLLAAGWYGRTSRTSTRNNGSLRDLPFVELALTLNRELIVTDFHLDVILGQSRQVGTDHDLAVRAGPRRAAATTRRGRTRPRAEAARGRGSGISARAVLSHGRNPRTFGRARVRIGAAQPAACRRSTVVCSPRERGPHSGVSDEPRSSAWVLL